MRCQSFCSTACSTVRASPGEQSGSEHTMLNLSVAPLGLISTVISFTAASLHYATCRELPCSIQRHLLSNWFRPIWHSRRKSIPEVQIPTSEPHRNPGLVIPLVFPIPTIEAEAFGHLKEKAAIPSAFRRWRSELQAKELPLLASTPSPGRKQVDRGIAGIATAFGVLTPLAAMPV